MNSHQSRSRAFGALTAFALVAFAGASAKSQVILDAGGFEPASGYSTAFNPMLPGSYVGQLEGQVDPLSPGGAFPNGKWQVPVGGTGTSTATVVSGVNSPLGPPGTQAVEVVKGSADARWGVHNSTYPSPGREQICIEWDMMVPAPGSGGTPGTDFGPFLGVESNYDQGGSPPARHGWLGVDATSGTVLIGQATTGDFILTENPADVAFGDWNSFRMVLDFSTYSYSAYLNGALLGSEDFVDGSVDFFTDAPIVALSEGTPFANLTASAFIDNFRIHEGLNCVPEPAAWLLVGFGTALIACRRRLAK